MCARSDADLGSTLVDRRHGRRRATGAGCGRRSSGCWRTMIGAACVAALVLGASTRRRGEGGHRACRARVVGTRAGAPGGRRARGASRRRHATCCSARRSGAAAMAAADARPAPDPTGDAPRGRRQGAPHLLPRRPAHLHPHQPRQAPRSSSTAWPRSSNRRRPLHRTPGQRPACARSTTTSPRSAATWSTTASSTREAGHYWRTGGSVDAAVTRSVSRSAQDVRRTRHRSRG